MSFWFLPPCYIAKCCSIKTKNCACFKAYKMHSYSVYAPFVSRPKSDCTSGSFSHGVVTGSNSIPSPFCSFAHRWCCSDVLPERRSLFPSWSFLGHGEPHLLIGLWVKSHEGSIQPHFCLFLDCTCFFHRSVILSYDHKYELFLAPFSPWVYF